MNKRILAGTIFIAAALTGNAHALSISGWGFKIGSIEALVDLKGIPNPDTKPTAVFLTLNLTEVEVLCLNPVNYNVAPGTAGSRIVYISSPVEPNEILEKGKVEDHLVSYDLSSGLDPETVRCNNKWTPIISSAAAKAFHATIKVQYCQDESCTDGLTKGEDVVGVSCVLNPVLREDADGLDDILGTDDDYAPVKGQEYECKQTTP